MEEPRLVRNLPVPRARQNVALRKSRRLAVSKFVLYGRSGRRGQTALLLAVVGKELGNGRVRLLTAVLARRRRLTGSPVTLLAAHLANLVLFDSTKLEFFCIMLGIPYVWAVRWLFEFEFIVSRG